MSLSGVYAMLSGMYVTICASESTTVRNLQRKEKNVKRISNKLKFVLHICESERNVFLNFEPIILFKQLQRNEEKIKNVFLPSCHMIFRSWEPRYLTCGSQAYPFLSRLNVVQKETM